ncbi:hypothetical protein Mkiyose1665_02660 [Mycobacterium kiyosense]|uniref:Uncharacterized protein n=1 Tax=Mycobacterium kiyosense TaxID=2871094 RepID=A0A9P3Q4Z2_9MYCO|nr:hypothetical protein IWGMT90018_44780 [Mycobacterium kiyosense]BDE15574.1 hypothetical protein MKCMC460_44340 [Mycobacterium sp. 20KCMC460]GLB81003.1 hypothetical protein SRL2020028_02590 [Mycobacterium kiyosense]GLB87237.1 hypothetical protein SRL2020130_00540 [Mycobacterium kiyosense]GLB93483.1 hypothetical protein SRL2020226_02590 [Mycobacterium kiyosense]
MRSLGVRDAGIVDQDRDGPESLFGAVQIVAESSGLRHVHRHRCATLPALGYFGSDLLQALEPAARDHDRGTGGREHRGEAPAESGGSAGDQRHLATQVGRGMRERKSFGLVHEAPCFSVQKRCERCGFGYHLEMLPSRAVIAQWLGVAAAYGPGVRSNLDRSHGLI